MLRISKQYNMKIITINFVSIAHFRNILLMAFHCRIVWGIGEMVRNKFSNLFDIDWNDLYFVKKRTAIFKRKINAIDFVPAGFAAPLNYFAFTYVQYSNGLHPTKMLYNMPCKFNLWIWSVLVIETSSRYFQYSVFACWRFFISEPLSFKISR